MKNINFVILFLLLGITAVQGQTIFEGKIVDQKGNPMVGATIIATENPKKGTITDVDGNFLIQLEKGKIKVSNVGYQSKAVVLKAKFTQIIVYPITENLEEVVISASRELQKRKEVPAAIGIVSSKQIEETKAVGIEQIVNQVPGVFMSTSKASGNEQHFMATRSPISTKSLFLYLEDGVPIRPVAVFNHNALLEMNSTSLQRVEILKGPASSIYGSEAIGGSFNFLTKNPTKKITGAADLQWNSLGLSRYEVELSSTINKKHGFYIGGHHIRRDNGVIGHSDYEKSAVSFKNVNTFSENLKWTNSVSYISYRSDMTGSLSEKNYTDGNYESNQTFTEREALAFRFRSTVEKIWNAKNKTTLHGVYRANEMNQIPSYRIRQNRVNGVLDGTGTGETNSNSFKSYVGLVQHKIELDFANSRLILGASTDFSPQHYEAEKIDVVVDTETAQNTSFTVRDRDYILKYDADIFNYAGYAQFEISPWKKLKFTAALRYDGFTYVYDNLEEGNSGVEDTTVHYTNFAPKFGANFNIANNLGIYSNYSKGFTPPQISTLFRNGKNTSGTAFNLKPATFDNYEIGAYFAIPNTLKVDFAFYQLDGTNRLVSIRDGAGNFLQRNAGKTRSKGMELGVKYNFSPVVFLQYSGSYATHRYIQFFENNVDYSNTTMPTAPKYIGLSSLHYKPVKSVLLTLEHEQMGGYATSFEGQAEIGQNNAGNAIMGTSTYAGHQIFNFRANWSFDNFEIWGQALNIFDTLYAVRASYSRWNKENSYSIGNPRAFHFGVKYTF